MRPHREYQQLQSPGRAIIRVLEQATAAMLVMYAHESHFCSNLCPRLSKSEAGGMLRLQQAEFGNCGSHECNPVGAF